MNKRTLFIGAVGLLAVLLVTGVALAQTSGSFDLSWHVLAGGGGQAASTNYAMNGTLGQAAAGFSDNASYGMQSGYWQNWPDYCIYLPVILKE
jgi:hypothetical protein